MANLFRRCLVCGKWPALALVTMEAEVEGDKDVVERYCNKCYDKNIDPTQSWRE